MSIVAASLGFPSIGPRRELASVTEAYCAGSIDRVALLATAKALRAANWDRQKAAGIDVIPSNDFSLRDQMLDTSVMLGSIPGIYRAIGAPDSLDLYFAMACGHGAGSDVPAQQTAQWFGTDHRYVVPEVSPGQSFALSATKPVDHFKEALALGHHTRPVILGPVTWLLLARSTAEGFDPLSLLPALLPVYVELLGRLRGAGADWVQIDEPGLVLDLSDAARAAYRVAFAELGKVVGIRLMLATFSGALGGNLDTALVLPIAGLHIDLVRAPAQLEDVLAAAPAELVLSLGLIDGRGVRRADLAALLDRYEPVVKRRKATQIAPSCSLVHTPVDAVLDSAEGDGLGFAAQKLEELSLLRIGLSKGRYAVAEVLNAPRW